MTRRFMMLCQCQCGDKCCLWGSSQQSHTWETARGNSQYGESTTCNRAHDRLDDSHLHPRAHRPGQGRSPTLSGHVYQPGAGLRVLDKGPSSRYSSIAPLSSNRRCLWAVLLASAPLSLRITSRFYRLFKARPKPLTRRVSVFV